jgi:hypothetical protein
VAECRIIALQVFKTHNGGIMKVLGNSAHMKTSAWCALFLVLPFLASRSANAQQYASTANQCVRTYYDSSNYNWLTYENTCSQAIYVTLVSNSGTNVGGLDLTPGRHDGPGLTAEEVRAIRGIEVYACPADYYAVDTADNRISTRAVSTYRCKRS